jgi:uncharacterized SAM-binding protein YcdF (DUF218 family)
VNKLISIDAITDFVFVLDEPNSVDLALVLGSPSISNVEPAIELYHSRQTERILISGHGPTDECDPEWSVYRSHAIAAGVPPEQILVECDARNTVENFTFSAKIIEREISWGRISRIAICCKPIHTRRAFMTARQHLPKHVQILMIPPKNPKDIQPFNWSTTARGRARVLGEVMRIGKYGLDEDLSIE